jgi:cyclohexa-1,5-dienecarbonyl-CoA hydratase
VSDAYRFIGLETSDNVAWLTLRRPPLNWLHIEMMEEINGALDALRPSPPNLLVIRAEGKAFSVGVEVADHLGDKAERMIAVFHGIFRRMDALGVPTLAVVGGAALGGGCELATYCDMVLASDKARLGQPEIQVGVFPPIAALAFPRIMGRKKAMELVLTGEAVAAQEALEMGLVNKVVPPEALEEEARAWAARFAKLSGPVLRLARRAVVEGWDTHVEAGLQRIEKIYMKELMATEDAQEGLQAFLQKREPVWKGR